MKTRKLPRTIKNGKIIRRARKLKTVQVTLPAHWASYLINHDSSGLVDYHGESLEAVHSALADFGVKMGDCIDVAESTDFQSFDGLYTEVAEYTFYAA